MNYKDFENCGLNKALDMISGKWKPLILYFLFHQGEFRFNELWRSMPKVSKKVLSEHLRQMEAHDLIIRYELNGFPPEVYYNLSEKGKSLGPILSALDDFGETTGSLKEW
ncbi:helix-turn-helix domain-containing protein [Gracilimonas sp.]|uniref:winged helix-turn-helix transcriptional regulator n=1 Tax=Gracilimonas sp. TaxID=1974203 RepID=UPI0032EBDD15